MIERIDTPSGRFYKTPEGFLYPSVTTVLSSIPNPGLDAWRNAVGEDEANRISKKATSRGTKLHSFCEDYLLKRNPKLDMFDKEAYKGLTKHLDLIEPIAIEEQLYSNKLRVAGTLDCLGKYDSELFVIDFKTTSSLKHDGEFDSYWLQTAAYSVMVYERLGLVVPNLLIIMQDLTAGECNVYRQKSNIWVPKFKSIRDAYQDK
jgi:genome maintenance exonuclease 1